MTTLQNKLEQLSPERRRWVEQRAEALAAEEMSLRQLRRAVRQTQVEVAQRLGVNQENVSRLERRDDLLLSTLSKYVGAMGGKLSLVAEFPDRPPVLLSGLGPAEEAPDSDWPAGALDGLLQVGEESEQYDPAG